MANNDLAQNSMVAGELSPRLEGRFDIKQHGQGMKQAQNGIVLPHGGFMRRSGTRFVKEVKDSTKLGRLHPFQVTVDQAYIMELGNLYSRFYANEGRLEVASVPVEVVTPWADTELADLQFDQEADVMYIVHPTKQVQKLSRTSATAFSLAEVVWANGKAPMLAPNLSATTLTVTGAGPFTITASVATFVTGEDIGRAVRVSNGSATAFYKITAFTSTTVVTATLESAATVGSAQTDWSLGAMSDTEGARAVAFHESRLWFAGFVRAKDRVAGSDSDDFQSFGSDATEASQAIYRRLANNAVQWMVSGDEALIIGTEGGEFRMRGDNNDILTPAGAKATRVTGRGSKHTQPCVIDKSVLFIQRNSRKLREFADSLEQGRRSTEFSILAEHIFNQGGAVECAYQQDPDSVMWIPRGDGQLVGYTTELEQKVAGPARQIFGGNFLGDITVCESAAVIPHPDEIEDQLWVLNKRTINGAQVRYVEFMEEQFRPDITATSSADARSNALKAAWFVDSGLNIDIPVTITGVTKASPAVVTATGHPFSDGDQVYLDNFVGGMTDLNDLPFLVANKTANTFEITDLEGVDVDTTGSVAYASGGEAREMITAVTGLIHLEGEVVKVLTDGGIHPDRTVVSGAITLDRPTARTVIGLKFKTVGETQAFSGQTAIGTAAGRIGRMHKIVFRVHNSWGGKCGTGPAPEQLEPLILREGTFKHDRPPPIVTKDVEPALSAEWGKDTAYWEQEDPHPLTVLAVIPRLEKHA